MFLYNSLLALLGIFRRDRVSGPRSFLISNSRRDSFWWSGGAPIVVAPLRHANSALLRNPFTGNKLGRILRRVRGKAQGATPISLSSAFSSLLCRPLRPDVSPPNASGGKGTRERKT